MKLTPLTVLSPAEIEQIHQATLAILSECGVRVLHPGLLEKLRQLGLPVDTAAQIVHFPPARIAEALCTIPRQIELFDREGRSAFVLGGGSGRVAAGHNAVFWVDSQTGQTRNSTVADVAQFARLCEHLEQIDMIGIPVMPQDIPRAEDSLLYAVEAVVRNSRKPVYFSTNDPRITRGCLDLLRAAGAGRWPEQAYAIGQFSPTSPLFWEAEVAEALMHTVEAQVPVAILPEPNAGISAPYTLAGLVTMNNAECLSGLLLAQLLRPGTKVMYASSWTTTDMKSGAALVGSAETSVCRIAGVQMARYYQVPVHTTAPNSDNHAHDEQNAWEKTMSQFCGLAAGADLVVNCGMFATGMTCSHEQLLLDAEISRLARRVTAGLNVSAETIAADLIRELGPQNPEYLTTAHTMKWLRSDEYAWPALTVRGPRATWEAAGAKDSYQLARDQVADLAQKNGAPLDPRRAAQLAEIMKICDAGIPARRIP